MERFQRWHPGCPPHPAGGADHGTHSDLPNDGGRGHYLGSLIQMSLHWFVGHRPLGGAIHRIHMLEHHGIYSGDALVADTYSDEEQSATAYYAAPAVALGGAAYATLPLDIFVVLVAALSASYAAHVYVHTQYHLNHSWLRRFGWFHRKRELHFVHHRDASKNFGVIEFVWDRVFGTYTPAER